MAEEHKDNYLQRACPQQNLNLPGTMDDFPLSRCQGRLETTVVSSPSPSDFKAAGDSCSPHWDDGHTLPSGDASRRETCSTDSALCEELQDGEQPHSISCSARSHKRTPASQKPDIFERQQSIDALASPNAAGSFDCEWTSCTTAFQTTHDDCTAGGGKRSSRSDCPLLESLLVWGHSNGDTMATAMLASARQAEQTVNARVSSNKADSFGVEFASFTTDFEARKDCSVAGDFKSPSRLDCPILKSLLISSHSSGDKMVARKPVAVDQAELATCRTVFWQKQGRVNPGRQTPPPNGVDAAGAVVAPNTVWNTRRHLNSCDLAQIRKMARIFLRAMRLPPCCRQQMLSSSLQYANRVDSVQHLVVHARNSALRLLHFACQLPQFRRLPPHVQVALLKAASAGCMVLHLAHSYNCERGCWLDSHGTELRPQDLTRLVPSPTRPELWDDVAAAGVFLKSLVCAGNESFDGDHGDSMMRFFSLLNAVLIMSPENVPCVRESDRDIAADVSDYQQSCIILMRRHLESSLSVSRAAKLLPTLLAHLIAIRSLALNVRIALLSERMVRCDSVLGDALSLELAMF